MVSKILVIGKELGDQLAQCMAGKRVRVLSVEEVSEVRIDGGVQAVVFDTSMALLNAVLIGWSPPAWLVWLLLIIGGIDLVIGYFRLPTWVGTWWRRVGIIAW